MHACSAINLYIFVYRLCCTTRGNHSVHCVHLRADLPSPTNTPQVPDCFPEVFLHCSEQTWHDQGRGLGQESHHHVEFCLSEVHGRLRTEEFHIQWDEDDGWQPKQSKHNVGDEQEGDRACLLTCQWWQRPASWLCLLLHRCCLCQLSGSPQNAGKETSSHAHSKDKVPIVQEPSVR